MKITELETVKSDKRGVIYKFDQYNFLDREKGSLSANHSHEAPEVIYLVKGEMELTVGSETRLVKAPIKIEIEGNIFHKLIAKTDIQLVYERIGE